MKVGTAVIGLAVVALLSWAWLKEHDARVRESAAAQRSQDSLVAAVAEVRVEATARHSVDSLASLRAVQAWDRALAEARAEAARTADSLGRLLSGLAVAVPDTLRPLLDRVLADWTAHLDADLLERQKADDAIAGLKRDLASLETSRAADLAAVNRQLDAALEQLRAANARARPGLLRRAVAALPWIGAAAGGGYVVGRLSR